MKFISILILTLSFFSGIAQTGINTYTPDPSAMLEIYSNNQGVLMPSYNLTSLSNTNDPVLNPTEGAMIYNTGGTFQKGLYFWDGTSWNRLIANREIDQILNLNISGTWTATDDQSKVIIPSGTNDNYVNFGATNETKYINTLGLTNPTGEVITLPAGTYKIDISFDCISPTVTNTNTLVPDYHLFVLDAAIVDALTNQTLTDIKTSSLVSQSFGNSIQGYIFKFVLQLNQTTDVKLLLKHGSGSTSTAETRTNQSGLSVNFYKIFE